MRLSIFAISAALALSSAATANAAPFFFSTGDPDAKIATASRPDSAGKTEIESADDFVLTSNTTLSSATFTGLLPTGLNINSVLNVIVEIYRVFPKDSDVGRTSGAPTFSTPQVPTRVNSPSDVEFTDRTSDNSTLSFTTKILTSSFTAANSVLNGINPKPNQTTGGQGPVTGQEVEFDLTFISPLTLPPDHYFFVPQVELTSGDFYWLSAPRPIVPPGTAFPPGNTDLQSWVRNENLDPDWLRVGADIVGAGGFNAAFSLNGQTVDAIALPEPGSLAIFAGALAGGWMMRRRRKSANISSPVLL